jgi:hypothetical protein
MKMVAEYLEETIHFAHRIDAESSGRGFLELQTKTIGAFDTALGSTKPES